jgi:glycosyltransferase involved in cell wall biosynthesis
VVVVRPYPVVVMLTSFDIGGTERQTVELVRRLDRERFRVHVACFHRRGALLEDLPASVAIESFPLDGFRSPGAVRQLLRFTSWCRSIGACLVHTCDLYANMFGLSGARLAGITTRIGSRRDVITGDKTRLQLAGQRHAYRLAHAIVANSAAAAAQLAREGVPDEKVRLIPNGVDTERFGRARSARPIRRVVMVANLRPEKGHDVLLAAVPRILAVHPDAEFVLAGSGPCRDALESQARAGGVDRRVRFLGECRNVPEVLADGDLFVLPSRTEAMPNAVIEAMAAGLPVVASDVGGIPELIAHDRTGLLVPAGDPAALAAAVTELMTDPARAAALGRSARAFIAREFGFGRMVARFEELYLSAIERRSDAPVPRAVGA